MWALTDYSDQVPVFVEQLGEYRQYVQAFAAMALVFSFTCIFKDGIMGLFLGYGGVLFVASRSGCDVNGGIVMCVVAVLTAYVMFSKAGEDEEEQGAPAAAGAGAGAGARATPLITPAKEAKKTK
ncbi:hypothetical protein HYH02_014911 [Chlamydomonas schloesseri]|uniref:Uncharacterized protein n=1 Tax=Chlamydomonas schloesseri TaxID=2026947 RepID=A0A835SJ58_9CHLO|nr:hypothetical protein HYH02_014911 [Chlamydomonas schloesseri]|eukprot:KAG2425912.1 hypothetical protein HYH02_014911 [Chlamydomonas schloesseri]